MARVLCSSPEFWLFYRNAVAHDTSDTAAAEHAAKIQKKREEPMVRSRLLPFTKETRSRREASRAHDRKYDFYPQYTPIARDAKQTN